MRGSRGGGGGQGVPHGKSQRYRVSLYGLDPLKTYKATEPAFNVESSSPRQRNAIKLIIMESFLTSSTKISKK